MRKVNDYWQTHNAAGDNGWANATYWRGDLAAYESTGDASYLSRAGAWAAGFRYGLPPVVFANQAPDAQAVGQDYIRLSQLGISAVDLSKITASIHAMVQNSSVSDWWYVDALNMSMPNFAELAKITGDPAYASKMYALFSHTKGALYDSSRHLWWRDGTFAHSSTYWSRGNGWAFAALAKVLDALPPSDAHYAEYLKTFQDMAAALKNVQRSDGFWNSDLGNPNHFGGPETSGTAFFTFGLAYGVNAGLLDRATYAPVALSAWHGLTTIAMQPSGFLGYVQQVSSLPGAALATSTANFGVGAFLLAGSQVATLP